MPLTFSIATGISFGFITYAAIKLLCGKGHEVHWLIYLLAVIFILRYAFIPV
jgi:AGZA family xanthine/uracil permease-like MFS transporter